MPMKPIALLADIHGNLPALDAVLADARDRGVTRFANLGDSLYGPLDPAGTAARLMALGAATVRGNQDRVIVDAARRHDDTAGNPTLRRVLDALSSEQIEWLASHPASDVIDDVLFLCHGAPHDDTAYLLEDVRSGRATLRPCDAVLAALGDVATPVVCCGHTHTPRAVRCGATLVVNPGSVGLPAYDDDTPPLPHVMETHTPHARYAIVRRTDQGWDAALLCVAYPWGQAAALAAAQGRRDWARWLATGRA